MQQFAQIQSIQTGTERIFNAAYFEDGNDKELIINLRIRLSNGEALSALENAYLNAAAQTGQISCAGGRVASNATLIQIGGRDAILTTAHAFIDESTGQPKCDLSTLGYYPNLSFYNLANGIPTDFEKKLVPTNGEDPLNLENTQMTGKIPVSKDFLIFYLNENISDDILPGNVTRGFMRMESPPSASGNVHLLGTDKDVNNGLGTTYQECEYDLGNSNILHTCDTQPSVSSSALTYFNGQDLALIGMHSSFLILLPKSRPLPVNEYDRNYGLSSEIILSYLNNLDSKIEDIPI